MEQQIKHKIIELQKENENLKEEKCQMNGEIVGMKDENIKLVGENRELKRKIKQIEAYMKKKKFSIPLRKMPTELMNELFATMTLKKRFSFLAKMPYSLLARNVQQMINGIKEAMKRNKLNEKDCGQKLTISNDGLTANYFGPPFRPNCVRAILPVPLFNLKPIKKPIISFYYEIEILNENDLIDIGFCPEHFPMEDEELGCEEDFSIAFYKKEAIWIEGSCKKFENADESFEKDNFIGIGIIHQPNEKMECFATRNGKFLGKIELAPKFVGIELFPVISFYDIGGSIRVNFGKDKWQFKEFKSILEYE